MVRKYSDIFSGFLLLVVSMGMFVMTFNFNTLTDSQVGPDFMPRIIAGLIGVVSIALIVSAFNGKNENSSDIEAKEEDSSVIPEEKSYSAVVISVLLMVGYLALMPYIGFLIMTTIYLFLQMLVLAEKIDKKVILFAVASIIASVSTYFVFRSVFYVMLPSGILG